MRVGYTVRKTGLMLIKGSTGSTGPTGPYAGPYYGLYIRALQPLRARTGTTGPRALMQREGPDPKIQQAFVDLGCPCNSRNEGPNLGRALATTRAMPPLLKVSWELIVPQDLVSTVHPCTNGWSQGRAVRVPRSGLSACCHSLKPLGIQQLRAENQCCCPSSEVHRSPPRCPCSRTATQKQGQIHHQLHVDQLYQPPQACSAQPSPYKTLSSSGYVKRLGSPFDPPALTISCAPTCPKTVNRSSCLCSIVRTKVGLLHSSISEST